MTLAETASTFGELVLAEGRQAGLVLGEEGQLELRDGDPDRFLGRGVLPRTPELFRAQFPGRRAVVVADGTSCRHQIHDGAQRDAVHVARVLAAALDAAV